MSLTELAASRFPMSQRYAWLQKGRLAEPEATAPAALTLELAGYARDENQTLAGCERRPFV